MISFINVFDFFMPRICHCCPRKLDANEFVICAPCLDTIKIADKKKLYHEFEKNFSEDNVISDFISLYVFEKEGNLQSLLHELKYGNKFLIGKFLGREVGKNLREKFSQWSADFLIPVPLYHVKKAERGYNQSDFIAEGISEILKIPVLKTALKRIRFTSSQTQLDHKERKKNVEGAFIASKRKILKNKKIILVDDVVTTGATVSECGRILLDNGADKVFAASTATAA